MYKNVIHAMPQGKERTYEVALIIIDLAQANPSQDAVKLLNSRRRDVRPISRSNATSGLLPMPHASVFKGKPSLSGMKMWLGQLGHSVSLV